MKIINNTSFDYATIGSIIDVILSNTKGKTHYVGQKEWSILKIAGKTILIRIRYLKSYLELIFDEKRK